MAWLALQPCRPYLLIAKYREAKPSLQAMREHKSGHPVLGIVVLAETDVIFRRAQSWARSQQDIRISVLQQSASEELATLFTYYKAMVSQERFKMVAIKLKISDAEQNNPAPQDDAYRRGCRLELTVEQDNCDHCGAQHHSQCLHSRPHPVVDYQLCAFCCQHERDAWHTGQFDIAERQTEWAQPQQHADNQAKQKTNYHEYVNKFSPALAKSSAMRGIGSVADTLGTTLDYVVSISV